MLYLTHHLSLSDGICLTILYIIGSHFMILSVSFTFIFLLKHENSFRNSSSHIIFAGLFFSLLLNGSLGCCGTVFTYCISGSCFILFFCFQRSRECSGTFLIYSMPLLWFLFFCISFFEVILEENYFFISLVSN